MQIYLFYHLVMKSTIKCPHRDDDFMFYRHWYLPVFDPVKGVPRVPVDEPGYPPGSNRQSCRNNKRLR